jgi:hypothetical protein
MDKDGIKEIYVQLRGVFTIAAMSSSSAFDLIKRFYRKMGYVCDADKYRALYV